MEERRVHLSTPSAIRSLYQPEPVPGAAHASIPGDRVAAKRSPLLPSSFMPSSRVAHRCQRALPPKQWRAPRHPPCAPGASRIPAKAFRGRNENRERRSFRVEFPVPQVSGQNADASVSLGRSKSLGKPISRKFRVRGCPDHPACRLRWIAFEHRFCGRLR